MAKLKTKDVEAEVAVPEVEVDVVPEGGPENDDSEAREKVKQLTGEETELVDLKFPVIINAVRYGPGKQVRVPTAAFEVWRHAKE